MRSCAWTARTHPPPGVAFDGPPGTTADAAPVAGFSAEAIAIAEVIGALAPLRQLAALNARAVGEAPVPVAVELERLRVRQRMTDAILHAMLDISSVLAEIDCENERGDQLAAELQKVEDRRTRRLGLASVLVGALTALVSGGLSLARPDGNAGNVAAIVGGTLEASVGAAVLFGGTSGPLRTDRNLLREVSEGPARPRLFPRTVWRFLNKPVEGEAGRFTPRELLIAQWRSGERFGAPGSRDERDRMALVFGSGGIYAIDDLNVRDAVLDLLEATIATMSQDLHVLLDELMDLTEPAAETPSTAAAPGP